MGVEMSSCLLAKFGTTALASGAVIASVPPDQLQEGWERNGAIGLLCVIVLALWVDNAMKSKADEARRVKRDEEYKTIRQEEIARIIAREEREDDRSQRLADSLNALAKTIEINALGCANRQEKIRADVDKALREKK